MITKTVHELSELHVLFFVDDDGNGAYWTPSDEDDYSQLMIIADRSIVFSSDNPKEKMQTNIWVRPHDFTMLMSLCFSLPEPMALLADILNSASDNKKRPIYIWDSIEMSQVVLDISMLKGLE